MDKESLKQLLYVNNPINIQMPNEIFEDLDKQQFQSYNHKSFAYSYYYIINYFYRNVVYGNSNTSDYSLEKITKIFLSNHRKVYYITKSGGILDNMGYTDTTNDYPITYFMDNDILSFATIKEYKTELGHSPRLSIKLPVKSFFRFDTIDLNGTYYSFQNTHSIDINKFINIITNSKLGHIGFYIYAYLKMMNDKFKDGYQISNQKLASIVGCTERTLSKYTGELEKIGLITSTRKTHEFKLLEKIYKIK